MTGFILWANLMNTPGFNWYTQEEWNENFDPDDYKPDTFCDALVKMTFGAAISLLPTAAGAVGFGLVNAYMILGCAFLLVFFIVAMCFDCTVLACEYIAKEWKRSAQARQKRREAERLEREISEAREREAREEEEKRKVTFKIQVL